MGQRRMCVGLHNAEMKGVSGGGYTLMFFKIAKSLQKFILTQNNPTNFVIVVVATQHDKNNSKQWVTVSVGYI